MRRRSAACEHVVAQAAMSIVLVQSERLYCGGPCFAVVSDDGVRPGLHDHPLCAHQRRCFDHCATETGAWGAGEATEWR